MKHFGSQAGGWGRRFAAALGLSAAKEASLVGRCKAGDPDAINELIQTYEPKVYAQALYLTGNHDEAQDVTQDTLVRCWRNIHKFNETSALSTWLYRITLNTCFNRFKAARVRKQNVTISLDSPLDDADHAQVFEAPDPKASPAEQVAQAADRLRVISLLEQLPYEQREILVMRYIQDLDYAEIARILKTELGTVKSRLNRARTACRELFEAQGLNTGFSNED